MKLSIEYQTIVKVQGEIEITDEEYKLLKDNETLPNTISESFVNAIGHDVNCFSIVSKANSLENIRSFGRYIENVKFSTK